MVLGWNGISNLGVEQGTEHLTVLIQVLNTWHTWHIIHILLYLMFSTICWQIRRYSVLASEPPFFARGEKNKNHILCVFCEDIYFMFSFVTYHIILKFYLIYHRNHLSLPEVGKKQESYSVYVLWRYILYVKKCFLLSHISCHFKILSYILFEPPFFARGGKTTRIIFFVKIYFLYRYVYFMFRNVFFYFVLSCHIAYIF